MPTRSGETYRGGSGKELSLGQARAVSDTAWRDQRDYRVFIEMGQDP